jgi:hypothetical protein
MNLELERLFLLFIKEHQKLHYMKFIQKLTTYIVN